MSEGGREEGREGERRRGRERQTDTHYIAQADQQLTDTLVLAFQVPRIGDIP